ncbi:MAG: aminopeptidase P family protein [Methanobacteriaceae archaeon]|nr:aminopeptidase P family protein [Methanobacteriaceae archaeon]
MINNENILNKLQEENIDSMLVFKPENIKYMSNFFPSSFSYIIIKDKPILYVSSLDKETAQKESEIEIRELLSKDELRKEFQGNTAVEETLDLRMANTITEDISKLNISNVILESRAIKTKEEIEKIKKSIKIAEKSIKEIDFTGTEKEAAASLEYNMMKNGSIKPAFDTIVASGTKSSSPHSVSTNDRVSTPIVVDWGARYDHYCSDITRTFIESERQEEIWNIVREAQQEGIKTVGENVKLSDVDNACREVITEYGYGEYFIHSTGHGFGLEIHEAPNVSFNSEGYLKENMIVTVEPGIYIPGEFGVRIEDDVLVKKQGKVLTSIDKKLDFTL